MSATWKLRWKNAGIRALKTIAQTAIGCIGAEAILNQINWSMVLSTALLAGVVSLLNNISAFPEVEQTMDKKDTQRSNLMEQYSTVSNPPSFQRSHGPASNEIPVLAPGDPLPASLLEEFTSGKEEHEDE